MALKFKKGDIVTQIVETPITGTVVDIQLNTDSGEVTLLVEDADGERRWFEETQIA